MESTKEWRDDTGRNLPFAYSDFHWGDGAAAVRGAVVLSIRDVYRDCLICGRPRNAVRLYQRSSLSAVTDDGTPYTFSPDGEGVAVLYYCERDTERDMHGCGSIYSANSERTGDMPVSEFVQSL